MPRKERGKLERLADYGGLSVADIDRQLGLSGIGVNMRTLRHYVAARRKARAARQARRDRAAGRRSIEAAAGALLAFLELLGLPDDAIAAVTGRVCELQRAGSTGGSP